MIHSILFNLSTKPAWNPIRVSSVKIRSKNHSLMRNMVSRLFY